MGVIDAVRLNDPTFLLPSPHAEFAALRTSAPVCYDPRTDAWLIARYSDVQFALRHPETFVSGSGTSPEDRQSADAGPVHGGDFMLASDAARHSRLRTVVQPGYTQPRVASWEDRLRSRVSAVVGGLPIGEPFDARKRIAKTLAISSVSDYLGIPGDDIPWLDEASAAWRPEHSHWSGETPQSYPEHSLERYFADLLLDRAAHPRADVLSMIAGERGATLSLRARLMLCIDLIVAGNEPTAAGISGAIRALAEHPDAYAQLRHGPDLMPTAVNELLRWVSPVPYMCRTAAADVELAGQTIPAGAFIYLLFASANRDEQTWGNPDVLDVARADASKQLSFGRGSHVCIGAPLVRQLFRILLEELTSRYTEIVIAGPVQIVPGIHMPHLGEVPTVLTTQAQSRSLSREA